MQAPLLSKLTTVYVPAEDRIRISGDIGNNKVVNIWLTQRMLNRLLPHMTQWLEKLNNPSTQRADLLQSIEQQQAQSKHSERVQAGQDTPVPPDEPHQEWLSLSVDIQMPENAFRLIFKDQEKNPTKLAVLQLQPVQLRQWLNVLFTVYKQGQWPSDAWPDWMQEQTLPAKAPAGKALH